MKSFNFKYFLKVFRLPQTYLRLSIYNIVGLSAPSWMDVSSGVRTCAPAQVEEGMKGRRGCRLEINKCPRLVASGC